MNKIKVGIAGGAGYTGGEVIRLLLHHPQADIVFVHSRSNAGQAVSMIHKDLNGDTDLAFTEDLTGEIDVLFLCLGHGESARFLETHPIAGQVKIIDLSQDFRISSIGPDNRIFTYGLPEYNREDIQKATNIANPGCFATAIQLALLPLAHEGITDFYVTGITGSTGAGQSLQPTSHFSWRANNISPYKTLTHQHLAEINQTFSAINHAPAKIHFVPWRGDFARGIFISATFYTALSVSALREQYASFYDTHPFTHLSGQGIDLKQVVNTNKCMLYLEKEGDTAVVHSAIDNLLKGASGQAVQNMNLLFGLDEATGLKLKAGVF